MNVILPKVKYPEVWEGNAKLVKLLETVKITAAKKVPGCSSTTSNAVLRAELGMYPLKTCERREKVEMATSSEKHAKKEVASHN